MRLRVYERLVVSRLRQLNDPLDGPSDKHPPGEAAGYAPQPRGTHVELVALDAVYFVSH